MDKREKNPHALWPAWYSLLTPYRASDNRKAVWQLVNTLIPYFFLWYVMIRLIQLGYSYTLVLAIAIPAAAFGLRLFILFHDCVHDSLFTSKRANKYFGYFLGVLVFTSFASWRFNHLRHHATYANLDARGFGDIWTMTLKEYKDSTKAIRVLYRLYRNPFVLIGMGAIINFLFINRFPERSMGGNERRSIKLTNLLIVVVLLLASWLFGLRTYILIQLPLMWFAGAGGIWLFYVQHHFKGVYWAREVDWEPLRAAMEGSSYYKLPSILRWFSGNIGYHHIHHLGPMIPNYHLKKCYEAIPALQVSKSLNIKESISTIQMKLWDEENQEMVSFPLRGEG